MSRQVGDGYPQRLLPPRPSIRGSVCASLAPAASAPVPAVREERERERGERRPCVGVRAWVGGCVGGWALTPRSHVGNSCGAFSEITVQESEKLLRLVGLVLSLVLKAKACTIHLNHA